MDLERLVAYVTIGSFLVGLCAWLTSLVEKRSRERAEQKRIETERRLEAEHRLYDLQERKIAEYSILIREHHMRGLVALAALGIESLGSDERIRVAIEQMRRRTRVDPWEGQSDLIANTHLVRLFEYISNNNVDVAETPLEDVVTAVRTGGGTRFPLDHYREPEKARISWLTPRRAGTVAVACLAIAGLGLLTRHLFFGGERSESKQPEIAQGFIQDSTNITPHDPGAGGSDTVDHVTPSEVSERGTEVLELATSADTTVGAPTPVLNTIPIPEPPTYSEPTNVSATRLARRDFLPTQTYHDTPRQTSDWLQLRGSTVYYRYALYLGNEGGEYAAKCTPDLRVVGDWGWGWSEEGVGVKCLDHEWLSFDLSPVKHRITSPTKVNIRNRDGSAWGLHGNTRFLAPCILSELGSYNLVFQSVGNEVRLTRPASVDPSDQWIFEPHNRRLDVCRGGRTAVATNPHAWPFRTDQ